MQNELQTALFQAFDTLNLQRVKTFSVPSVYEAFPREGIELTDDPG